jgi:HlyD family secretion protein
MAQQSIADRLGSLLAARNVFNATRMISSSPPWWRRRRVIIGAVVVLLIIVLSVVLLSSLNRRSGVTYNYQQATTGNLSVTVSATGPLQSATYNLVFTGTGGKISEIDVKVGQSVVKGQVVAQLDKTSLQDAYNQQQSVVQAAQDALNSAQTNLANQQALGGANVDSAQTILANDQAALTNTRSQQQAIIGSVRKPLLLVLSG